MFVTTSRFRWNNICANMVSTFSAVLGIANSKLSQGANRPNYIKKILVPIGTRSTSGILGKRLKLALRRRSWWKKELTDFESTTTEYIVLVNHTIFNGDVKLVKHIIRKLNLAERRFVKPTKIHFSANTKATDNPGWSNLSVVICTEDTNRQICSIAQRRNQRVELQTQSCMRPSAWHGFWIITWPLASATNIAG